MSTRSSKLACWIGTRSSDTIGARAAIADSQTGRIEVREVRLLNVAANMDLKWSNQMN